MKRSSSLAAAALLIASAGSACAKDEGGDAPRPEARSAHEIVVQTMDRKDFPLSRFANHVILVVNVASR